MAFRLPLVVARPPTPNAFRHFQTTPTPNQYRSATALSVRMARASVSFTQRPDPPRCSRGWTRGQEIRASVQDVTVQFAVAIETGDPLALLHGGRFVLSDERRAARHGRSPLTSRTASASFRRRRVPHRAGG